MPKYFAYGSNLNQEDLDKWCKNKGYCPIKFSSWKRAKLKDYALVFNVYSNSRKCGVANIERKKGEVVEGVLFIITKEDLDKLDVKEGARGKKRKYEHHKISVETEEGKEVKNVITYWVPKEKTTQDFIKPSKEYLNIIIEGAERYGLSKEWIDKLKQIPTKD